MTTAEFHEDSLQLRCLPGGLQERVVEFFEHISRLNDSMLYILRGSNGNRSDLAIT